MNNKQQTLCDGKFTIEGKISKNIEMMRTIPFLIQDNLRYVFLYIAVLLSYWFTKIDFYLLITHNTSHQRVMPLVWLGMKPSLTQLGDLLGQDMQPFKFFLSLGSFTFQFLLTFILEDDTLPLSAFLCALLHKANGDRVWMQLFSWFFVGFHEKLNCNWADDFIWYLLNQLSDHGVIVLQEGVEFRL